MDCGSESGADYGAGCTGEGDRPRDAVVPQAPGFQGLYLTPLSDFITRSDFISLYL